MYQAYVQLSCINLIGFFWNTVAPRVAGPLEGTPDDPLGALNCPHMLLLLDT